MRFAESVAIVLDRRLLDASSKALPLSLVEFYPSGVSAPVGAIAELIVVADDDREAARITVPLDRLPASAELPLHALGEGDYRLRFRILVGDNPLASGEYRFSLVKDLAARLEKLATATNDFEQAKESLDKLSAAALAKLLATLAAGQPNETDYPAARLLAEAEAATAAAMAGNTYYGPNRSGQFWLRAGTPRQDLAIRLLVPDAAQAGKPLPLVIALHGAGGSENLFFDGYGQGAIADLCQQRGWLVVSPRTAGFGLIPVEDLVASLARVYPIDRERVYMVGHSMGAMQVTAAVSAKPEMFAAVAALGGGGSVKRSSALAQLPYYVAAGSQDFALGGARRLADNLRSAGAERVEFKEYADVEHLLIVQEALPEVFRFFDAAARR